MTGNDKIRCGFFVTTVKGKETDAFKELTAYLNQKILKTMEISSYDVKKSVEDELKLYKTGIIRLLVSHNSCFLASSIFNCAINLISLDTASFKYIQNIFYLDEIYKINQPDFISKMSNYVVKNAYLLQNKSFKITYKCRCSNVDKTEIFRTILDNTKESTVDLSNPDYEAVFQCLKGFGGISFGKYKRNRNLNGRINKISS